MIGGAACPRRLWSLWEIMRPFDVLHLMHIHSFGDQSRALAQLDVYPNYFKAITKLVTGEKGALNALRGVIDDKWSEPLLGWFSIVERFCEYHQFSASLATAKKLTLYLQEKDIKDEHLSDLSIELVGRLEDEMSERMFLSLTPEEARYYRDPSKGWEGILEKFASATFEVNEATKCLALNRYTASVFHLMRCMEIAIRATGRCLGVADPVKPAERNWGSILRTLKGVIDNRNSGNPAWLDETDRRVFEDVYVSIDAVRNVWRNATMHVEQTYTEEDAEDIWRAVRAFMRKLASRCDENGDPKA
jgi:hypothetical protein